ncbi:MAG: hypothetical protein IJU71_01650 [Selenomonadaceae bacterium]|nr:hypothetical protein [Selenomonadaceae bacterium]
MFRFFVSLALVLSIISPCHAQDFQFVDSSGLTGYYVDMDSVETESGSIIFATIAVIKADANRKFLYDVRFNHVERTYQIVSSKTVEYDTQNVLDSRDDPRDFRAYAPNSEMSELINFIMHGGDLP